MFGYKRSYAGKWGGLYYPRGRYSKYFRRGTVGRAAAGAAAAKRSDKTETYSCTVNGVCVTTLDAQQNLSHVKCFHPYNGGLTSSGIINDDTNLVHGGAVNDRGFRMKCATYDELKLDSMKVTLTPAQLLSNNNITFTLCTMWDRKATPKECGFIGGGDWMQNGAMATPFEIFNNEGTIKSPMTGNTIYGFKRYCRASSILEKGGYHDSSILYNSTEEESPLKYMYLDAWIRNPLAFAPALYLTIYSPASMANATLIALSYKIEYTFTFRNPKSDLDWFLTVEAPGYVNPDMRNATHGAGGRTITGELAKDMRNIALIKKAGTQTIPQAMETLAPMLKKTDEKKVEEEKDLKEEEDMKDDAAEC